MDNSSIRKEEMRCFLRAFKSFMLDFVKDAVILKRDVTGTVFFEFCEENGVITTRRFPDDLIFAYAIAVDAIYEWAKKDSTVTINADENSAKVSIKN